MAPFVTEGSDKKMILDKEKLKNELIANKTRPGISTDDLNKIETKLGVLASLGNDKNSLIDIGLNNLGLTYKQIASP